MSIKKSGNSLWKKLQPAIIFKLAKLNYAFIEVQTKLKVTFLSWMGVCVQVWGGVHLGVCV